MEAHLARALVLLEQSRLDLAEKELRLALASDPDNALIHAYLARCLAERDELDEALASAKLAVHLDPVLPFAHLVLAQVLLKRNRFDEAEGAAREALRLEPDQPHYHAWLGWVLIDQRRWDEALAEADKGLELDAEDLDCRNLRAVALRQLGRNEEAAATMADTLAQDPENAFSHANLGWNYLHQHQPDKALEHFREALRIDPTLDFARAGLVEALKGRYLLYGLMLRYFLWMTRLSAQVQWAVIVGGVLGYNLLRTLAEKNPALKPWVTPVLVFYIAFVVLSWIAMPVFNLLLRFNRFGRHALSDDQRRASTWVGLMLVPALGSLVTWLITGNDFAFIGMLYFGLLLLPVAGVFACEPGWPRKWMIVYTLALAILPVLYYVLFSVNHDLAMLCLQGFALGSFLSTWVANILMSQTVRR